MNENNEIELENAENNIEVENISEEELVMAITANVGNKEWQE